MPKKPFKFSLLVIIFVSCTSNTPEQSYDKVLINNNDFEEIVTLEAKKANDINKYLLNPRFVFTTDSLLIVYESGIDNGFLKLFSLRNHLLIKQFGERGRGPKEFSGVVQNIVKTLGKKNDIAIFDWSNARLAKWDLDASIKDSELKISQSYVLPPRALTAQRAVFINDSLVIGTGGINSGSMFFVNTKNDSIFFTDFVPRLGNNTFSKNKIPELYRSEFGVNFNKNLIVLANKWFNLITFFDMKGQVKKVLKGETVMKENLEMDRILYYKDVKITDMYIYAVFLNMSYNDMKTTREDFIDEGKTYSTEIRVFNWKGKPVRKYIMKDKFLQFIDIDPKNHKIYSIDVFSENNEIIYFEHELIK